MSRIAKLKFQVEKTEGKIDGILLYLASKDPHDLWSRKIAIQQGSGSCQIAAPGQYVLTWYLWGESGGALQLGIADDGTLVETLGLDETRIRSEQVENYGLLDFVLGG